MQTSKLRMYSLGYVAEDIEEDDHYVKIFPIEVGTSFTGDLTEEEDIAVKTKDMDGNAIDVTVTKSNLITAKWFNFMEPNRLTAPNVCAGETVMIWQFGESDRFYWTSFYNEVDLRKREKVVNMYSNKEDNQEEGKEGSIYYTIIDTINKFLRLHTDDSDEELTAYDIELNTKDGIFVAQDGRGNIIELLSEDDKLSITTVEELDITTKAMKIAAEDTLDVKSDAVSMGIKTLEVKNDTGELIAILSELIDEILAVQHIGNLGAPTAMNPASIAKITAVQTKLDSFKA